jgi:hypothetical protein
MSSLSFASASSSSQDGVPYPPVQCGSAIASTFNNINKSIAISNAMNSPAYRDTVNGPQNGTFVDTYQIDRTVLPSPTCTEEVLSYNVAFVLYNRTGGWAGYLVITEGGNLTVLGSSLQTQAIYAVNHLPDWGGFQVYANSGATQAIYASGAGFTQPAVGYPSGGCTSYGKCNLAIWVGLTDTSTASSGNLVQDGTWADCVVSGTSCASTSYVGFWELLALGVPAQFCSASNGGNLVIKPGDSILAETLNEVINGGKQ